MRHPDPSSKQDSRKAASPIPWIVAITGIAAVALALVNAVLPRRPAHAVTKPLVEDEGAGAVADDRPFVPAARPSVPRQPVVLPVPPPIVANDVTPEAPPPTDLGIERRRHHAALDKHALEPANGGWAREMTATVGRGLEAAAAKGRFKVADVDCRSRTCVATVDWDSASVAYSSWIEILKGDYGDCGVEVVLDDPANAAGRFGTKVLFPCARQQ